MCMTGNNKGSGEHYEKALSDWISTELLKIILVGQSVTRIKLRNAN